MVSLGETITIRASKFQTRYQTGDGRFAICAFTAKPAEKDKLPDGLRMYGTTAMFLASGRIPESDTGLAAKRMTDSTHMAADTIHHACGLVPANSASGFSPAKDCTIRPGFIGIDEMSMVGTHLFGFAMDAIPNRENTRIVLLGDVDQLSPVARGDALRDLIQCGLVKTTVLDCNYRQGADSAITDAAIKIREDRAFLQNACDFRFGEQLLFTDCKRDDLREEADAVIEAVVQQYLDGVAQFGVKGTIVLTPTHFDRGTPAGYLCKDVLNNIIRDKINPDDATKTSCKIGNQVFRTGDRVIQRKNTDDAINGDLGSIVRILNSTDGDMEVEIDFDGKPAHLLYGKKEMRDVELAYAITVHSSQGCEFPMCILPVSMSYGIIREWEPVAILCKAEIIKSWEVGTKTPRAHKNTYLVKGG